MAKKKTAPKRRRSAGSSKKTTRRRSKPRTAGFSISPMAMLLGIGGAFAAPFILEKIPVQDAKTRNAIGAGVGLFGSMYAAKKMPEILPALVGFTIGSGVMLTADLFPDLAKSMPLPKSTGGRTIGRLTQAELDKVRRAVQERMNGSGMPVIQGMGVPVINGLPDVDSSFT